MSVTQPDPRPVSQVSPQAQDKTAPYPPSIIDRFLAFVERLPIPYGFTYLLLFIVLVLVLLVFSWIDGWLPAYQIHHFALIYPFWLCLPLAFITYLDAQALQALSEFRPLLDISDETNRRLAYEFTTMPVRGVVLNAVFWIGGHAFYWYLALEPALESRGAGPLAFAAYFAAGLISFLVGSVIYYHSVRQLRLVSRTIRMVGHFDLFRLDPVYAFSVLTSRTAICWVILLTLNLIISPLEQGGIPELSTLIVQIALSMGGFLLPLQDVHRRLALEKRSRLADVNERLKATLARLHKQVDENSLQEVGLLNEALKGLTTERDILAGIPTWPWRPGLFASFISLIVLPVVLFLIQFALGKWLGP